MWKGWIIFNPADQKHLESLGVSLIEPSRDNFAAEEGGCTYECRLTTKTFDKLDTFWGRYIWGIEEETDLPN